MCGRFTITLEPADFQEDLEVGDFPADFQPRYNVAPTQPVAAVRDVDSRRVEWFKWGLIPFWAKDPSIGERMINARSETLAEKPSFKQSFARRRCLILADGFFEWKRTTGTPGSTPYYIYLKDRKPFAFAGLWDQWQKPGEEVTLSCTIITCAPNELISPLHDRMPVILDRLTAWEWLKPTPVEQLNTFLRPYPAEKMALAEVSRLVNNPRVDTPEIIQPV